MRIDLIYPTLPPRFDAIGQYTACMAAELARQGASVRIWTAREPEPDLISGVEVVTAFDRDDERSLRGLAEKIAASPPDAVILQYNPFSYERLGRCKSVPWLLKELKRACPGLTVALMAHECFTGFFPEMGEKIRRYGKEPWLWKAMIMGCWQRPLFQNSARNADTISFSTEPWIERFRPWFPGKTLNHWPIGSGVTESPISRQEARARLDISPETLAIGYFGTSHISRMVEEIKVALRNVRASGLDARLLYIGPNGADVCSGLDHEAICADGPLPDDEVSRRLQAVDVYLSPFLDGASTRRTSMITGLQHRLPTISTRGINTDSLLLQSDGKAFMLPEPSVEGLTEALLRLSQDSEERYRLAEAGRAFFDQHFAWPVLATKLLDDLK